MEDVRVAQTTDDAQTTSVRHGSSEFRTRSDVHAAVESVFSSKSRYPIVLEREAGITHASMIGCLIPTTRISTCHSISLESTLLTHFGDRGRDDCHFC